MSKDFNRTIVQALPTRKRIAQLVAELIEPEHADRQAKALITIIHAVANFEDAESANLANEAMMTAYRATAHCEERTERGFREFALSSGGKEVAAAFDSLDKRTLIETIG